MTEPGETDDFGVLEHVLTIERHLGAQLFDCVIYNTGARSRSASARAMPRCGAQPIATGQLRAERARKAGRPPIGVPLVSEHPTGKIRHHPDRLAVAITALAQGKLGAWRGRSEAGGA